MLLTITLGVAAASLAAAIRVAALCVVGLARVRSFRQIAMSYLKMCSAEGRPASMRELSVLARAMEPMRPLDVRGPAKRNRR